jgi:hypothetical protein
VVGVTTSAALGNSLFRCGDPIPADGGVSSRTSGLALGSIEADAYSREEVSFLSLVANQAALAVDEAVNFDASHARSIDALLFGTKRFDI